MSRLENKLGNCEIEYAASYSGDQSLLCGKRAIARCADCGSAICSECRFECCGDSFCDQCFDYHGTHTCLKKPVQKSITAAIDEVGRIIELRREIAEIAAKNKAYLAGGNNPHCAYDTEMYQHRLQRLQSIREELAAMLRRTAA
jgi:hypothetical protein